MAKLLNTIKRLSSDLGIALSKLDLWIERLLVSVAIIAIAILTIAIAWGIIEGRYSIISPYHF